MACDTAVGNVTQRMVLEGDSAHTDLDLLKLFQRQYQCNPDHIRGKEFRGMCACGCDSLVFATDRHLTEQCPDGRRVVYLMEHVAIGVAEHACEPQEVG